MNEKFDVTGMTCSACSSRVEKCVSKLEGVEEVSVNLLTNSMQVKYKEGEIDENAIISAVEKAMALIFIREHSLKRQVSRLMLLKTRCIPCVIG